MKLEKIFLDGNDEEYFLSYCTNSEVLSFGKEGLEEGLGAIEVDDVKVLYDWLGEVLSKIDVVFDEQSRKRVNREEELEQKVKKLEG